MTFRTMARVSGVLTPALLIVLTGLLTGCRREPPEPFDPPPTGEAAVLLKAVPQPLKPLEEFVMRRIIFESPVFYGTRFSSFDFDNVTKVTSLIGPYTLSATPTGDSSRCSSP